MQLPVVSLFLSSVFLRSSTLLVPIPFIPNNFYCIPSSMSSGWFVVHQSVTHVRRSIRHKAGLLPIDTRFILPLLPVLIYTYGSFDTEIKNSGNDCLC